MIQVTFRPLPAWPHPVSRPRRHRPFSAPFQATFDLLDRELRHLKARSAILAAGFREQDLRLDGWPKSGSPAPSHPGVELSFDSRHGRLVYATDACSHWQDNVRSLGLGLQALRAVDRFGITRRGEQYAGWKQLTSGIVAGSGIATAEDAWNILGQAAGAGNLGNEGVLIRARYDLTTLYRDAAKRTHPDQGGDAETFVQVQAAYEFLKGAS